MMLPEFDQEMANTRKTLERVPEDKFAWKPHVKSTSLGGLATHLGNIPSWVKNTFAQDELDIAPPGAPPFRLEEAKSRSELLAAFDKNVADARAALESARDEKWREPWSLLHGGNKIFSMPRTSEEATCMLLCRGAPNAVTARRSPAGSLVSNGPAASSARRRFVSASLTRSHVPCRSRRQR